MKRRVPARCTICSHPSHVEIDVGLARGVAIRAISRRFKIGIDALYRHQKNHLPPQVRAKLIAGPDLSEAELERLKTSESTSLLANIVAVRARLFAALDEAENYGDLGQIARLSGHLHENFSLVGRLIGELGAGNSITINSVLVCEDYLTMRAELVQALKGYPDAARAVAAVLHKVEAKAVSEMQVIEGRAS